ncbi:MAG: sulfur carrier protein ThiS, partial [Chloroflexota bacterium]
GSAATAPAAAGPVLAMGGNTPERDRDTIQPGAAGVAAIDAIAAAADPESAARDLSLALSVAGVPERLTPRSLAMSANITESAALQITANGKPQTLPAGSTIHDFLAGKKLADSMAIVERNGFIVPRAMYPSTVLETGDVLEVVHAVGGG